MAMIIKNIPLLILKKSIHAYQYVLSPYVGCCCRFMPSCSHYALEALDKYGVIFGMLLIIKRLCRCQPFGGRGIDNVPCEISFFCYKIKSSQTSCYKQ